MANLLKVNEVELQLLTGQDDPEAGSQQLLQEGPDSCVITKGAEGSYFRVEGGFDFVPAYQVETIDATGCGDAFIAGLLSRLISNVEWLDLLRPDLMRKNLYYANAVGALTAQIQGVIPALPTVDAVASFLSQKPEWRELNARN